MGQIRRGQEDVSLTEDRTELSASTDKIKALLITCSRMGKENDRKGEKEEYRKSS